MKKYFVLFISVLILSLGPTLPAIALLAPTLPSLPGLYNTGVDNSGFVLANGSQDNHYVLSSYTLTNYSSDLVGSGKSTVVTYPGAWVSPTSGSGWIAPQFHADGLTSDPVGTYDYKLTFSLAGLNPSTASISGQWAADNSAVLLLNGNKIAEKTGEYGFSCLATFSQTGSYFVKGNNTLEFIVSNWNGNAGYGNPSGLLVTGLTGTANPVPIPAAVWLFGSGLFGLVGIRRKFQI